MIEDATQQGMEPGGPGITPRPSPMATCPMAKMCEGMMKKPPSGFSAMLAGIVLIAVGALVFVEPRILVWLMSAVFVLFGAMLLVMARLIRSLGARLRDR